MIVDNSKNQQFVISLNTDAEFAPIIETYSVELSEFGNLTLKAQRIYPDTVEHFNNLLDDVDKIIVKLAHECSTEFIIRKNTKDKIKLYPDFIKYVEKNKIEVISQVIKPTIDQKTNRILELLGDRPLYKKVKRNPGEVQIEVLEEELTTHFHFKLNNDGIVYYPTFRYFDENIIIANKGAIIITQKPCRMLINNKLFLMEEKMEGKRLNPFLTKMNIQVPKSTEKEYFKKFIHQIVESFNVKADGFYIYDYSQKPIPQIRIIKAWNDEFALEVSFDYKKDVVLAGDPKTKKVLLEEKNGKFSYHKINRDIISESGYKNILKKNGLHKIENDFYSIGSLIGKNADPSLLINWINDHYQLLEANGFKVLPTEILTNTFYGNIHLSFDVSEKQDWFDINAVVTFGEFKIPFFRLKKNILNHIKTYTLPNGQIVYLPEEWFSKYKEVFIHGHFEDDGEIFKLNKFHFGVLNNLFENPIEPNGKYGLSQMKDFEPIMPLFFEKIMRHYQVLGFKWMAKLQNNRFGGILADDMGLGKTVQTLCLLQFTKDYYSSLDYENQDVEGALEGQLNLFESNTTLPINNVSINKRIPSLVVMPTSLIYNWEEEIKKFTPKLKTMVYAGLDREFKNQLFFKYDIILTTYGTVRNDIEELKTIKFRYIILDESQVIKNPASKVSRAIRELNSDFKLSLTGTPIENSLMDLWSQMQFLNPGILGNYQYFKQDYVIPIERQNDEDKKKKLKNLISPFILRRTKKEVAQDLPDISEKIYYSEMDVEQKKIYEEIKSEYRNQILSTIEELGEKKAQFFILKGLMQLRQVANHPILCRKDFQGSSGKFDDITATLRNLIDENHKVLIFSQFVSHLKLYETWLEKESVPYSLLIGSTAMKERKVQIDNFRGDTEIKVFLLSLKAGNTGLNLIEADYVFLCDPWWNPAVEQQAINRAHRIGQTKNVFAYKFISKDSVEEKILKLQERKKMLSQDVLDGTMDSNFITKAEVEDLFS